jgi:DnaJ like chaperone protein
MNFRQFFTTNTWWGKIIGAFLGYLVAGPTGAVVGVLIGNFFDRGLAEHFSRPHWHYHAEKQKAVQEKFFEATFLVMGHIAKADGRVSEHEIEMAKILMEEMGLNRAQIKQAKAYFNQGKEPSFSLKHTIVMLQQALHGNHELLKLFIDIQYRAAQVDGLSFKKQEALNAILHYMGFAPLHAQYRFYEDFANYSANQYSSNQQQSNQQGYSSSHGHTRHQGPRSMLDHAYAILEVSSTTPKQDVKRAYRRLMSKNHPDKLIAKGLPESMIKIANEKTQAISKAYEQICESKGW